MSSFDTNVLLYLSDDTSKAERAEALLGRRRYRRTRSCSAEAAHTSCAAKWRLALAEQATTNWSTDPRQHESCVPMSDDSPTSAACAYAERYRLQVLRREPSSQRPCSAAARRCGPKTCTTGW